MKTITRITFPVALIFVGAVLKAQTPESSVATDGAPPPAPIVAPGLSNAVQMVNLSPAAAEVVRLTESSVTEDVIVAYVRNASTPFNLTAENVLYLRDIGFSSEVISAMLARDKELAAGAKSATPAPTNAPGPTGTLTGPKTSTEGNTNAVANYNTSPAPTYESSPPVVVNYFYNDLAPYGTWVVLDTYGWCWQPRAVVCAPGWRPYCHGGRWVYTQCGWYWASDYSWGWAPFHYGRWYLHPRCGWVWTPGQAWAPAWVTWRVGTSGCGWAPLPPATTFVAGVGWTHNGVSVSVGTSFGLQANHYTFVASGDLAQRDLSHRQYSIAQVQTAFRNTTVINNTTVSQNIIVNQGIAPDRVIAAGGAVVPRATIREAPASSKSGRPMEVVSRDAVVWRQELKSPAKPANALAQRLDSSRQQIQPATIVSSSSPTGPRHHQPMPGYSSRHGGTSLQTGQTIKSAPGQRPRANQPTDWPPSDSDGRANMPGRASGSAASPLVNQSPPWAPAPTQQTPTTGRYQSKQGAATTGNKTGSTVPRPYQPKSYYQNFGNQPMARPPASSSAQGSAGAAMPSGRP